MLLPGPIFMGPLRPPIAAVSIATLCHGPFQGPPIGCCQALFCHGPLLPASSKAAGPGSTVSHGSLVTLLASISCIVLHRHTLHVPLHSRSPQH
ncbi:unnamed protein product [Staurois parvus]|uniref:Uncharacterized protein n=1 Tax=Staurois parvus TaxID=386267 RepID=A0ABN9EPF1_9NEOB|nr:unnamed protein product [Staurois parvus]